VIIEVEETSKRQKSGSQRSAVSHFQFLSWKHWNNVVVSGIFGISILKTPQGQSFMLSSGSAYHMDISAALKTFFHKLNCLNVL